ncbi:MAG: IclR family transcriptional regulator [Chloroflexi bacterium]|nr:IclR family transcriptional regulator [Chloroflexota bacterium]
MDPATATRAAADTAPMARWVAVLEAFTDRDEWGVRDLATHLGLPRSAVHRILHEAVRQGLLAAAVTTGRFRVGPALARLAVVLADRLDVRSVARPVMERAAAELDETLVLALYSPGRRQFAAIDAVESSHPIRYIWGPLRQWSDLHTGSSGKGILAFLPDEEQDAIVAALPDPVPGPVPTPRARLRAELRDARARGHVVSHGERFPGAVGVSAPIRDATGRVIGDLVFGWPDNRNDPDKEARAGRIVMDAAARVSAALGYRP